MNKKFFNKSKKTKESDNHPQSKSTDSNEIAKQIAIETARDTEKLVIKIGQFLNKTWSIFVDPSKLSKALKIDRLDRIYELFLRDEKLMKVLALIVAIITAMSVRYAPNLQERYSVDINGYKLLADYDTDRLVIEGLPDTVDVTLVGEKNQVDIAKTKRSFEIFADVRDLPAGRHTVNLEYSKIGDRIDVKINPSTIAIEVKALTESDEELTYDYLNMGELDKVLVLPPPELAVDSVKVKGPQQDVDRVAAVKAIINVKDLDVTNLEATQDIEVPVFAYDSNGDKIENLEIRPSKVHASIEIISPQKEVKINPIVTGSPPDGYSLGDITISPNVVKLYGDQEALDDINELNIQVDLYQLDSNKEHTVLLDKPENVQTMNLNSVTVTVEFEKTETKVLKDVVVGYRNLDSDLKLKAQSIDEATVNLTLTGSKSLLNEINSKDIDVYIDLEGYGVGEHEVPIAIDKPKSLGVESDKLKVKIIITE